MNKGHEIKYSKDISSFGRGQIILKHNNTYIGGTEKKGRWAYSHMVKERRNRMQKEFKDLNDEEFKKINSRIS